MSTAPEEPQSQNGLEPDPTTNPKPESESEPVAQPEAIPEPVPEPEAKLEPVPEPKAKPEPVPEPEAKPELQPEPEAVVTDGADPNVEEVVEAAIQSNNQASAHPELKKDEGSRTFTMRELLGGLKNDQSNDVANDSSSPYSYRFAFLHFIVSAFLLGVKLCKVLFFMLEFRLYVDNCSNS